MNNCKITLSGSDRFTVRGEMEVNDGAVFLKYEYEGDSYSILFCKSGVKYSRFGALNLEITLEEGNITDCIISEGGMSGTIPVYTSLAHIEISDSAAVVVLKYNLGGEDKTLRIVAVSDGR